LLFKAKKDVLLFFTGAGVSTTHTNDIAVRLKQDRATVNKYEIVRTILARLNQKGDAAIRERREVVKRVVEFEDFSTCWPEDQLKAKGLVAQIRQVVNVKDSFTRMNLERKAERSQRLAEQRARDKKEQERKAELSAIKSDLFALFREQNPQKRGKAVEGVLNRLFQSNGILIRDGTALQTAQKLQTVILDKTGTITHGRPVLTDVVGIPLPEAIRMASLNPARVLNLDGRKGSLETGKDADIAIFNSDFSAWRTMIAGQWIL